MEPRHCIQSLLQLSLAIIFVGAIEAGRKEIPRRSLENNSFHPAIWQIISLVILALLLVSCVGVGLYYFVFARKRTSVAPEEKSKPAAASTKKLTALTFTMEDINKMTNEFDLQGVIEDAGHCSVHLGKGGDGTMLVVKRAKKISQQGAHMFGSEVSFLTNVNHPHIVSFIGSCVNTKEQILVFEHVPNGSLESWLRNADGNKNALNFQTRLSIAIDVAEAIAFMHSFTKPTIIHRDIKSETILLDRGFNAKLGGLGILKHLPGEAKRIREDRKRGYLDPEYFQTFKVTTKCDVYAYGVVLLEMITGKPPMVQVGYVDEENPGHTRTLPQYAMDAIREQRIEDIVDPRLPMSLHTLDLLKAFALVASACVNPLRKDRPDMSLVLPLLQEIKDKC